MSGQHDPGDAGALGRTQEGPQVAGVGDPVQRQHERRRASRGDQGETVQVDGLQRCSVGQHALGGVGPRLGFELGSAHLLDGHPVLGRQVDDLLDDGGGVQVAGQPHVTHLAPAGQQQLPHGPPALDLVAPQVPPRRPGRPGWPRCLRSPAATPAAPAARWTTSPWSDIVTRRTAPASLAAPSTLRRRVGPARAAGTAPAAPATAPDRRPTFGRTSACSRGTSATTRRAHGRTVAVHQVEPCRTPPRGHAWARSPAPRPPKRRTAGCSGGLTARSPRRRPSRPRPHRGRRRPDLRIVGP